MINLYRLKANGEEEQEQVNVNNQIKTALTYLQLTMKRFSSKLRIKSIQLK